MTRFRSMRHCAIKIAMTVAVLPFASHVQAQIQVQTPLTEQAPLAPHDTRLMYETDALPTGTEQAAQPAKPSMTRIGDSTATLLAIQREGRLAAPAQPMLGVEADAAYRRYLKSFDHPIPAQLNSSVGEVGGGSGAGVQN